jgi:hypothetical protein
MLASRRKSRLGLWVGLAAGFLGAALLLVVAQGAAGQGEAAQAAPAPIIPLDVCQQHPQVCPLDAATWVGEPNGWQTTGRTWVRHSATSANAPGFSRVWQWSEPYSGTNPAFLGYRQNPYADYSASPLSFPADPGFDPAIYDWERWQADGDNWRLYQYGVHDEALALYVGESDCASGVLYPVVDGDHPYAYSPLSVQRAGACVGGGYLATFLVEEWGPPRTEARRRQCENPTNGISAAENAMGNLLCNLSPHVGVIYQVYMFQPGPAPQDYPVAGCEAVVSAWGWPKPHNAQNSGQAWETWFRNGELRWTYWLYASSTESPAPDDYGWWAAHCAPAWQTLTNWVYGGEYLVGSTRYTDSLTLPATFTTVVSSAGGVFTSTLDGAKFQVPAGAFSATVRLTQTIGFQRDLPPTGELAGTNHWFDLAATYLSTGSPAVLQKPLTVTVRYAEAERGGIVESSLDLFRREGQAWLPASTSGLDPAANHLTATVAVLGQWALLGDTLPLYLPVVTGRAP